MYEQNKDVSVLARLCKYAEGIFRLLLKNIMQDKSIEGLSKTNQIFTRDV